MAITDKKISEVYSGRDVSSLSDRPNQDGMTAAQLKARFDQLNKELFPKYNALIDEMNNDVLPTKADKATTVNGHPLSADVVVTKGDVGLGNVDNTADADKPLSTASTNALALKADKTTTYTKTEMQTSGSSLMHWDNLTNKPNFGDFHWKAPVANRASLPLTSNELGDNRVVLDDGDGKQAVYTCIALTGVVDAQWSKVADVDWMTEEQTRITQETARVNAENIRLSNESTRQLQEDTRQSQEVTRVSQEGSRVTAEGSRVTAEGSRVTAEGSRVTAEGSRVTAETGRSDAEGIRVSNEDKRILNEAARNVWEAYNALTAYVVGNKVSYLGSSYVCILDSLGNLPTNVTYWLLIASKGDTGANTTATNVTNTPSGNISSTTVQGAINELDTEKASKTQEAWITPTLMNGAENFSELYESIGYMKDEIGFVHYKGFISIPNTGDDVVITSLPTGYRVIKIYLFPVYSNLGLTSGYFDQFGNMNVKTNGSSWYNLNGLTFKAEA